MTLLRNLGQFSAPEQSARPTSSVPRRMLHQKGGLPPSFWRFSTSSHSSHFFVSLSWDETTQKNNKTKRRQKQYKQKVAERTKAKQQQKRYLECDTV